MKNSRNKKIVLKIILCLIGLLNIVGVYFLENPNRLNISSAKQMGLYRGLLQYNDKVGNMISNYLVIIVVIIIFVFLFLVLIKKLNNYLVLLYFIIVSGCLWLKEYHNPNIYIIVLSLEFVIYGVINIFLKIREKKQ